MINSSLAYDYTNMMSDRIGQHGISEEELNQLQPQLDQVHQEWLYAKDNNQLGFTRLPYQEEELSQIKKLADQVAKQFSTLVVLGIGGSDLGARALQSALNHTYYNQLPNQTRKLYFAGANTDPKELADLIDILDLEQTALFVVSKSGGTIETMAAFVYLRQKLIDQVGLEQHTQHIIVATDPDKGSLRAIVTEQQYRSLPIPSDVGGRFSILTAVGLFPAAYVQIDIEALIQGAQDLDQHLLALPAHQNPALLYAGLQYLANTQHQQNISVLMPYAEGLRDVAMWYRQLWAESLGKAVNLDGQPVNVGPTPIASLGATDQHSQVQLYNEGPFDKVITLIKVEESSRSLVINQASSPLEQLSYLEGLELNEILTSEATATALALAHNGRPNATISLPQVDEYHLGQLFYFFEVATAYSGSLYHIDAYDQPGVELGKHIINHLIGQSPEPPLADMEKWLAPDPNRQI